MNKFDRGLQEKILEECISAYPDYTYFTQFIQVHDKYDENVISANINYLEEHRLITIRNRSSDDPYTYFDHMRATVTGVDFLLNDGGLSAILKVQTINLHNDTITAIEDLVKLSNLTEQEQASVASKLRGLPASAITHLTNELISKAVSAAPAALPIIQKFLHMG
ncbi:hypothetical protein ACG1VR_08765 [Cedecea davisae]|uniref:hypothetical protein n=1 Tax=Cedecea davisae TaxID=158484 RepID=UPI00376EB3BA